jgi:hypothetical protein
MSDTKRLHTLLTVEESHAKLQGDNFVLNQRIAELEDSIEINKRSYAGLYNDYLEQMNNVLSLEMDLAAMKAENERLRNLIKLMQSAVQDYLPPYPQYADKDWLVDRLIYLLDGPEQRAAMKGE